MVWPTGIGITEEDIQVVIPPSLDPKRLFHLLLACTNVIQRLASTYYYLVATRMRLLTNPSYWGFVSTTLNSSNEIR